MPKVSVIMSVYNNANYLHQAIQSVLNQNFFDFELIVINDNSFDNTEEIINSFNDKRIVYIKNLENRGLIYNLNAGLKIAKGYYIARLDGDDFWNDRNKLRKQVDFLDKNQEFALVGTMAKVINNEGKELFEMVYPKKNDEIKRRLLFENCFVHSSVLYRKDISQICGNYLDSEKYIEDYGLWLRMGSKHKLFNLSDFSVSYLLNSSGETQKHNLMQIKGILKLIKKHKNNYQYYFLAKLRWLCKYLIVSIGGLKFINIFKSL